MRSNAKIVAFNDQIANRGRGQVQPQRLPVISIVERNVDGAFGSCKQQTLSLRILAYHVGILVVRNAVRNLSPVSTSVARTINVWPQIVEPESIDGRIRCVLVKVAGVKNRNLLPCFQLLWRHIGPVSAAIGRPMNQPIIGTGPNKINVQG